MSFTAKLENTDASRKMAFGSIIVLVFCMDYLLSRAPSRHAFVQRRIHDPTTSSAEGPRADSPVTAASHHAPGARLATTRPDEWLSRRWAGASRRGVRSSPQRPSP